MMNYEGKSSYYLFSFGSMAFPRDHDPANVKRSARALICDAITPFNAIGQCTIRPALTHIYAGSVRNHEVIAIMRKHFLYLHQDQDIKLFSSILCVRAVCLPPVWFGLLSAKTEPVLSAGQINSFFFLPFYFRLHLRCPPLIEKVIYW